MTIRFKNLFGLIKDPFVGVGQVCSPVKSSTAPFLVHTGGAQTINPKFSLAAGLSADVHWGDGSVSTITGPQTATVYSHTYTTAGNHKITLSGSYDDISYVYFRSMAVSGDVANLPSGTLTADFFFTSVSGQIKNLPPGIIDANFYNTAVSGDIVNIPLSVTQATFGRTGITGDIADLSSGVTFANFYDTGVYGDIADLPDASTANFYNTAVTGDLADLPATCEYINFSSTAVVGDIANLGAAIRQVHVSGTAVTGDIADLPVNTVVANLASTSVYGDVVDLPTALLTSAYLSSTSVTCSGIFSFSIGYLDLRSNGYNVTQVDAIVEDIYTNWSSFTDATPELLISGNASPSGTYQDGDPPTTGKEYIYEIVNDPETTGNHKWTVTYTA